ncbi:MAG: uroporphyrinogen decarboxylase family protein [candidate division WOR-3 bacterium]|nr:uroporphyrinogen decarboxylase family protein [candidate division WOR-3 bacterium]MCX7837668.1 uroporphyrinogen decarboxylase family protein [candidate division WOR-3 bacterium]MDW8113611.1 uroporphyrinogen decarboxylase family protein [candidate division WOR-3 bacterium]
MIENIKVFPLVVANHAAYLTGQKEKELYCDGEKLGKALLYCQNYYGYDAVIVFSDVYVEMEAMGGRLEYLEDSPPEIKEYPKLIKIANPQRDGRIKEILKAAIFLKRHLKDFPIFVSLKGPFSLATLLIGVEKFFLMLIKNEKKAKEIINIAFENQLRFLKAILEIDCIPFIGDPFASGSLIGAKLFENYALPPLKELIKECLIAGLHICGDTKNLLPLIIETKAKIISLETDVSFAKRYFPEDIYLMGSVPTHLLVEGDIFQVKEECEKEILAGGRNFILSTACDVPKYAKKENVKTMVDVGHFYKN